MVRQIEPYDGCHCFYFLLLEPFIILLLLELNAVSVIKVVKLPLSVSLSLSRSLSHVDHHQQSSPHLLHPHHIFNESF